MYVTSKPKHFFMYMDVNILQKEAEADDELTTSYRVRIQASHYYLCTISLNRDNNKTLQTKIKLSQGYNKDIYLCIYMSATVALNHQTE